MTTAQEREAVACDLCGLDDPAPLIMKNGFRVVRCRGCALVYVSPRLRPMALSSLYDEDSFQSHQMTRAEDAEWRHAALARARLLASHQPTKGRLLDVGCSTGWFLGVARDEGWKVVGLDVSAGSVAHAKKKGFDARLATLDTHDLAPRSFEAITMFDSIEHMPSPMAALRAVHDLLADDGVVFITTPNVDGALPRLTYQLFGRTFGAWEHPGPPGHIFQFSGKTLAAALARSGFSIVHEATEPIALAHTVGELEEVVFDILKRKVRRPTAADASPAAGDAAGGAERAAAPDRGPTRYLRRALRRVVRGGAWALTGAVAAPAPLVGAGDSLVVVARKRR